MFGLRAPEGPARALGLRSPDVWYPVALLVIAGYLFRYHLLGNAVFIGNADRLASMLNVHHFFADNFRHGEVHAWYDRIFGGVNLFGFWHTFPNPFDAFVSLFPNEAFTYVYGAVSGFILFLSALTTYVFIRAYQLRPTAAFIGALNVEGCTLTIFDISQMYLGAVTLFILLPLILMALRHWDTWHASKVFAVILLGYFGVFQFGNPILAAYSSLLTGGFAIYLAVTHRTRRPIVLLAAGGTVALLAAFPRLLTAFIDSQALVRSDGVHVLTSFRDVQRFFNVQSVEFFRLFDDGIFGRFASEAAALGNNINLTEGMLAYTSVFSAVALLSGAIWFAGKPFGLYRMRQYDVCFWTAAVTLTYLIVLVPIFSYLAYVLFIKQPVLHSRILGVAIVPAALLISVVLVSLYPPGSELERSKPRVLPLLIALGSAGATIFGLQYGIQAGSVDSELGRAQSFVIGKYFIRVMDPPIAQVNGSARLTAYRPRPNAVVLAGVVPGNYGKQFQIGMSTDGSTYRKIGAVREGTFYYTVGSLAAEAPYWFKIMDCDERGCIDALGPTWVDAEPEHVRKLLDGNPKQFITLKRDRFYMASVGGVICLLLLAIARLGRPLVKEWAVLTLGALMAIVIVRAADHYLNAPENTKNPVPFRDQILMMAQPGDFTQPSEAAIQRFASRLESAKYRTVFVCEDIRYPEFCDAYAAESWRLRTVGGYATGVPAALAHIPWPPGVQGFRTIRFLDVAQLPWEILAFLNVKYAIVMRDEFYRNRHIKDGDRHFEIRPGDITIIENPIKPVPRAFFASKVVHVPSMTEAASRLFGRGRIPDPALETFVEGVESRDYESAGTIDATFSGDRVILRFDPSSGPRFLVLNEQYHPGWGAFAGNRELRVYRANVAMRGLEVPQGVSSLELRFVPYYTGRFTPVFPALAFTIAVVIWRRLRKVVRVDSQDRSYNRIY